MRAQNADCATVTNPQDCQKNSRLSFPLSWVNVRRVLRQDLRTPRCVAHGNIPSHNNTVGAHRPLGRHYADDT
jgi:hypothetical protein